MYRLREAGAACDRMPLDEMPLMEVSLGKFSTCLGCRNVIDTLVRLVRWGDDFSLSGRKSLCNAFQDDLGKHLLVKTTAVMGPNVEMGDVQEAIHLNRHVETVSSSRSGRRAVGARGRPLTRGNLGVTDGTEQQKQSCEYSWCADD